MIAKHSHEQSEKGEGVEVAKNEECSDPVHGKGRYTEKRIYLSRLVTFCLHCHQEQHCNLSLKVIIDFSVSTI